MFAISGDSYEVWRGGRVWEDIEEERGLLRSFLEESSWS